jgi:hypothetical protein
MAEPESKVLLVPPITDTAAWNNTRPRKITFQHLPNEVKLLIYHHALVEPLRWNRMHRMDCPAKPKGRHHLEEPPFCQTRVYVTPGVISPIETTTKCGCAKRMGLNLLLASRAINDVASPILWGQNTWCFLDAAEVTATIGSRLRSVCRKQIRSISIMSPEPEKRRLFVDGAFSWESRRKRFWETIKRCHYLQKLDIPATYLEPSSAKHWAKLDFDMPALGSVRVNYLISYWTPNLRYQWVPGFPDWQMIYVRCSRLLPLREHQWSQNSIRELRRELDTNFLVHTDTAVKTGLLGMSFDQLNGKWISLDRMPPDLNEQSRTRQVTLPTGETVNVCFYGLPKASRHRIKSLRQRMALDRQQMIATGSTVAQHHVEMEQRRRRKQIRENVARQEANYHNVILAERRLRRLALKDAERADAKLESEQVRRAVKERIEDRKVERKRTGRQLAFARGWQHLQVLDEQ